LLAAIMPVLLYCISRNAKLSELPSAIRGVAGTSLEFIQHGEITLLVSRSSSPDAWLQAPLRTSALEFHRVILAMLKVRGIIPFRFPTILSGDEAAIEHLRQRSGKYEAWLQQFGAFLQMDVGLSYKQDSLPRSSGTEYLRHRQGRQQEVDGLADKLRKAAGVTADAWHVRGVRNGVRCSAVVERGRVEQFREKMRNFAVPVGIEARVSGPWPVEFVDDLERADTDPVGEIA